MKLHITLVFSLLIVSSTFAQKRALPEILVPDAYMESEAQRLGGEAFRILPRGMFKAEAESDSYKDEDNPIGIRGGGAFYSFSTGLHSYNKTPEILFEKGLFLVGAFYGFNYGFIRDLGAVPLSDVSLENVEVMPLTNYVYPQRIADIRSEQDKREYKANGFLYRGGITATIGHTYVVRTIIFDDADILVALTPLRKSNDGSLDIVFKTLRKFETPKAWYSTDAQLKENLAKTMVSDTYSLLTVDVKDNVITLRGKISAIALSRLKNNLYSLRPAKIVEELEILDK
ncbi:hypothetical protein BH10ACI2_BH10ACI2_15830 [soil metagenome]